VGARARLSSGFAALRARPRLLAALQTAAVTVLLLVLAYEMRDAVRAAWPRLLHADLSYVLLGIVLLAAYYLLFVLGWQRILRAYSIRLGYGEALGAEMLSMLAKYIPGGVWTPAARVLAVRRAGIDNNSVVLATILLEAGLSAVAGVLVLVCSLPFVPGVDAPLWPVVAFALLAAGLLHPRVFAPLATRILRPFGGGAVQPLPWAVGLAVMGFYAFTWLVGGAALTAMLVAVGGDPGPGAIAFLGGASAVGAIVAVVTVIFPSGLGVREGAVGALMLAIAPESAVVGAVVLNRLAITVVEALLLGAAAVVVRNRRHSYPAAE
jgi:glycosyltransferase 2 family protein